MDKQLRLATLIATALDDQFSLFGRRFGLNGLLGLAPGVGDIISALLSLHLIWIGMQMKLPLVKLIQMGWNVLVNFVIGLVPFIGDYADFFNKANLKNLAILKEFAEREIIEGEVINK